MNTSIPQKGPELFGNVITFRIYTIRERWPTHFFIKCIFFRCLGHIFLTSFIRKTNKEYNIYLYKFREYVSSRALNLSSP